MNQSNKCEKFGSGCLSNFGNEIEQGASSVVNLDAIVIAKLVCLSEETKWRTDRNDPKRELPTC